MEENEFHLAETFAELVNKFLCNADKYDHFLKYELILMDAIVAFKRSVF